MINEFVDEQMMMASCIYVYKVRFVRINFQITFLTLKGNIYEGKKKEWPRTIFYCYFNDAWTNFKTNRVSIDLREENSKTIIVKSNIPYFFYMRNIFLILNWIFLMTISPHIYIYIGHSLSKRLSPPAHFNF